MIALRPYQKEAIETLWAWFRAHPEGNPIVEGCVGCGKSLIIAETIRQALAQAPTRVLMCVASRELCRQNAERLLQLWPAAPVGIYSAGLRSRVLDARIVYATIGSIHRRWRELGDVSLMLIDECHNVSARDRGMYRTLIRNLLSRCPGLRVIGWTGTAFHGSGIWLHDAEEALFSDIAVRITMREMLEQGYLAPLVIPRTETRLRADGVRMRGGDYVISQLAGAIDKPDLVAACADEMVKLGSERKRWFVYGATVEHCGHVRDALCERGISAEVVSARTPHPERDRSLARLRDGRLRAIVNVATMTTGIDVPELDLIALMRNTRSPVLYTQIMGRGMRTAPGKRDCQVLDFTDTLATLGPVDLVKGRARPRVAHRSAPFRICDGCGARQGASARVCAGCGQAFPLESSPRHGDQVSQAPALSCDTETRTEWLPVTRVAYREWLGRRSGIPTLRVDYLSPLLRIASEWVCIEHAGPARTLAANWWIRRAPRSPIPKTVAEAFARRHELRRPRAVLVSIRSRYPEVTDYEWDESANA